MAVKRKKKAAKSAAKAKPRRKAAAKARKPAARKAKSAKPRAKKKAPGPQRESLVGRRAPDFSMVTDDGTRVSLDALRGRKVVLYFYPKDDTPGCTLQACNFRDSMNNLGGAT